MRKVLKWFGIAVAVMVLVGIVRVVTMSPEERARSAAASEAELAQQAGAAEAEAKQALDALPEVSAADIAKAYEENTVAADALYKGKRYKVSGKIADISTDFMGAPYLTLRGGVNPFMEPQFAFDKEDLASLAQLKKGQGVTLACTGAGDIAKTPVSKECALL